MKHFLHVLIHVAFFMIAQHGYGANVPIYLLSSFRDVPRDIAEPVLNVHPNLLTEEGIAGYVASAREQGITTLILDVELGKQQSVVYRRLKAALGREGFTWADQQREPYISIANNVRCEAAAIFARLAPDLKQVSYLGGDLLEVPAAAAQLENPWSPDRKHKGILRYGSAIMPEIYRSKGQLQDWLKFEPEKIKRLRSVFPGQILVGFEVRNWVDPGKGQWRSAEELMQRWKAVEPDVDGIVFGDFYFADGEREFDREWEWVKFIEELRK